MLPESRLLRRDVFSREGGVFDVRLARSIDFCQNSNRRRVLTLT
jgi:hypothetical protein